MERNDLVLYLDIPEFSEALHASKWRTDIVLPQAGDNICPENLLSEKTLAMLETVSAGEVWEDMKDDCRTMRRVVEHELFRVTERGFHLRRDGTPCCTLTLQRYRVHDAGRRMKTEVPPPCPARGVERKSGKIRFYFRKYFVHIDVPDTLPQYPEVREFVNIKSLLSEADDQGYPGELCVEAVFDFDDDNALEITYLAKTDKTTVVNLTNHVYFNLAGDGSGSILDHELRLNSSKVLEMNDKQIPTGRLLDAAGTPQDFREFRPFRPGIDSEFNHIRDFKGYDHPFVIDGWQPNILGEVGELREKSSGRCVKVLSSQPSVMIYTGNWLAGGCPETKTGGRYDDYDGVAIECQNYPDAVNHPDFPSPLLRPGELYCQKIVFRFGTF